VPPHPLAHPRLSITRAGPLSLNVFGTLEGPTGRHNGYFVMVRQIHRPTIHRHVHHTVTVLALAMLIGGSSMRIWVLAHHIIEYMGSGTHPGHPLSIESGHPWSDTLDTLIGLAGGQAKVATPRNPINSGRSSRSFSFSLWRSTSSHRHGLKIGAE